jgi:hypothetical protein
MCVARSVEGTHEMTKGRYVAPKPTEPSIELTPEQQQAHAAYTQLGIAAAALRVAHDQLASCDQYATDDQLAKYLPVTTLEHIRLLGENIANIMYDMNFLHGTMVTQGVETLPRLKD